MVHRGGVVLVNLNPTSGHEQKGTRPCVVVSDPSVTSDQRYPLVAIVPVTGTAGRGALYPALAPGKSGLTKPSWAMVDQLRCIDKTRIARLFGRVSAIEMEEIDEGLRLFLGL
jgi:mRNA interferase MazF